MGKTVPSASAKVSVESLGESQVISGQGLGKEASKEVLLILISVEHIK